MMPRLVMPADLVSRYEAGATLKQLARQVGCAISTMSLHLRAQGVKVRSRGRPRITGSPIASEQIHAYCRCDTSFHGSSRPPDAVRALRDLFWDAHSGDGHGPTTKEHAARVRDAECSRFRRQTKAGA